MDPFEAALLIGAVTTALICWRDRRAVTWIVVGTINFAITTTYARHVNPLVPPPFVTGVFDAATCALIITFGRHKWERVLGFVFQFMVLVSFGRLVGLLQDRFLYVVTLELANWTALAIIGGTRIMGLVDGYLVREAPRGFFARHIHRLAVFAFSERSSLPFWSPVKRRSR